MTDPVPPWAAVELMRWAVGAPKAAEGIVGDLTEEFHARCVRRGPRAAMRWFWIQSLWISIAFRIEGWSVRRQAFPRAPMRVEWLEELPHAVRSLRRATGTDAGRTAGVVGAWPD